VSLNKKTNFAVIFPGQGSQYSGMGRFLYDNYQTARETFKLADDTLNFSLSDLCFNGNIKDITKTYNTQPALLTISYIMYQIYIKKRDLRPSLLLGHSLGELTALVCSNAIKFTDGIKIARDRGLYMQECGDKSEGSMLAVLSDDFKLIKKFCSEISSEKLILEIANYNSNNQIVLSGNIRALDMIKEKLKKENIKCIRLNVSAAFHSPIMESASSKLRKNLSQYKFSQMSIPVISNISGKPYLSQDDVIKNLSLQVTKPVQWVKSISNALKLGANLFVEVGPKSVLKNLNKNICESIETLSLDIEADLCKFNDVFGDTNE
jgi:[acyl-carrier-protein] S-malonyltransferase